MRNLKRNVLILMVLAMLMIVPSALAVEEGPAGALGINAGFLLAQTVNFLIVAAALYFLMIGPMGNMLDERKNTIEKGLQDAQEAANARRNAEADAEKIRTEARAEVQKTIEEGRQRGEDMAQAIRSEAQEEAEKIRSDAREAAQVEKEAELAGLRNQVATISVALANRLIGEALDDSRQKALISDFFSNVPADARALSGDVTVVSAMPLEDAEKKKIEGELGGANVSYQVDPNILGGLVIRSEDRVVDGSVRSGLN
ncbi:MAG: F0F1 ATP synthase subunit B, partial [Chloroflexota bacterium]